VPGIGSPFITAKLSAEFGAVDRMRDDHFDKEALTAGHGGNIRPDRVDTVHQVYLIDSD
jgi:hypothetical protein